MPRKILTPVQANNIQTIGERITYLRAKMKPYMTQQQLADRSGLSANTIWRLEKNDPKMSAVSVMTLKKIAHALDSNVYVNIRPRTTLRGGNFKTKMAKVHPHAKPPSPVKGEYRLLYPDAPALPVRTHKNSERCLMQAAKIERSHLKKYRQIWYRGPRKGFSEKNDLRLEALERAELLAKHPDKPSRVEKIQQAQD